MSTTIAVALTRTRLTCVALFVLLLLALPLTDPDYFWHLKAGETIVTQRALPAGDIFSQTHFGRAWVLHEWLFEVLLFAAFASGGEFGVGLLTALFIMATLVVSFTLTRRLGGSHALAFALAVWGSVVLAGGWTPRPHLVTYLLFSIYLSILAQYKYAGARRVLWALPLLMVAWVNAHGGYVIGIALVFLFAGAEWLGYRFDAARTSAHKEGLLALSLVAAATLLASLANPEFARHWLYPIQVLGMEANQSIQEWQSPDFHRLGPALYLLLCAFFMLSYLTAKRKADLTELLVPGLFLLAGFVSRRHVPLAVLTVLPFVALACGRGSTAALAALWQGSRIGRSHARSSARGKQLGPRLEGVLNWMLMLAIVLVLLACQPWFKANAARHAARLPAAAADYVIANQIAGKMFNGYDDGGYLIYRLWPQHKVFIDGRVDVYGDAFFDDYKAMYFGRVDWKRRFDRFGFDFAILDKDAPIRQLLLAEGSFTEAYRDARYCVLLRKPTDSLKEAR